jgi:hypothetical protein
MNKHFKGEDFETVFKQLNFEISDNPEYVFQSRIGKVNEITNVTFEVDDASTYHILNSDINKIDYGYAETFYDFMMSGGGTEEAQTAFAGNESALKFVQAPESKALPNNFNTLYGPRIVKQLPDVINELASNRNSRRATMMILNPDDHALLPLDEKIEYPCCLNATYYIRDDKLHAHVDMRSQNTAVVLQMDIYIHARLQKHILHELNTRFDDDLKLGKFTYHMVSAHIYERDFEYVNTWS